MFFLYLNLTYKKSSESIKIYEKVLLGGTFFMKTKTKEKTKGYEMKQNLNKMYRCSICFAYCDALKQEACIECVSCTGKVKYTSLAAANASAEWFFEKDDLTWLGAYKCSFCNQYHLGHSEYKLAS